MDNAAQLSAVLAGDHRTEEERARDMYRHPVETLMFFGVEPSMAVVEVSPGGGWYSQVIAPYLNTGGGKFYAAGFPSEGASERALAALATYRETYVDHPEIYGAVEMTALGEGHHIAPPGSADVVLTFRNVHNWQMNGSAQANFNEFYNALKPGGVLGVVEHRADGSSAPDDGTSGYVYTDDVKALAKAAGFEFDSSSEVNANAADTKDHPFGVWTLPPVRRSSAVRGQDDPEFDRAKYDAIGESDRMTLKFRKPLAADGALLE
jgi:predicted methyltransferase